MQTTRVPFKTWRTPSTRNSRLHLLFLLKYLPLNPLSTVSFVYNSSHHYVQQTFARTSKSLLCKLDWIKKQEKLPPSIVVVRVILVPKHLPSTFGFHIPSFFPSLWQQPPGCPQQGPSQIKRIEAKPPPCQYLSRPHKADVIPLQAVTWSQSPAVETMFLYFPCPRRIGLNRNSTIRLVVQQHPLYWWINLLLRGRPWKLVRMGMCLDPKTWTVLLDPKKLTVHLNLRVVAIISVG